MFHIKIAQDKDLPEILEIEKESYPKPWGTEAFEIEISKNKDGVNIFLVAKDSETSEVLGYIAADLITDFAHISNIAVKSKYRKSGIGTTLLKEMMHKAEKAGIHSLTLEVRESNKAALNLYQKAGFLAEGKRDKYYENTEAAILMWKR